MIRHVILWAPVLLLFFSVNTVQALNIIAPGDPILAIDLDFTTGSDSPGAEGVINLLDSDSGTKYLNFGETNTGFIVTPSSAAAVQSFQLTTANDGVERDPASWVLYGTNDPITSTAHGNGREEDWTQVGMGGLSLPDTRFALGDPVGFSNSTVYSSYKMVFPTVKDEGTSCCMQVADAGFFSSMDGSGTNLLSPGNFIIPIRDVDATPSSNSPDAEGPGNSIDRDLDTKYLNFGEERSGFIVTPSLGASTVTSFRITTANDALERDPASWELYGTNDAIVTENNGIGDAENWTLIDSGSIDLPAERLTQGPEVAVNNTAGAFTSYRMIFPTVRDEAAANSMQIAEIALSAEDPATLVVNRGTGEVMIRADADVTFAGYEVISQVTQGLDDSSWTSIASTNGDPGDTWAETSPPGSTDSLAESDTPGGDDDGLTITAGNTFSLGNIWQILPSTFEDLEFDLRGLNGEAIADGVEYIGTELVLGDYSGNGTVGPEDWPTFIAGYGGDYTGATISESYLGGDLDGDFDSDINDFNLFVDAAGGAAALFGALGVPEPSSALLFSGALLAGLGLRFRKNCVAAFAVGILGFVAVSASEAQTFTNVGGVPSAISIPADQMNETEESGPENFFDDDFLDDPGAINDELFLLDYNDPDLQGGPFLQYAGQGREPKTVFFDYGSSVSANWFAYAQRSGADPTADRVGMFEFWFSNSDFGDVVPATPADAIVNLLPTDNRLQDSALRPYSLSGTRTGRYVAMRLTESELSADQPVTNIGGHEFRLLSGPADVVLEIDRSSGNMTLSNNLAGAVPIEMKSYTIESPSGALDPASFDGVGGDSNFPLGNGTGNGWEIGGGSNNARLAEGYFNGDTTLAAGASGISLGNGYNELSLAEDVVFLWTNSDGDVFDARVEYVGPVPDILPGDYNNNGVVDTADYGAWLAALGGSTNLANDITPGVVDQSDYDVWKARLGNTNGFGNGTSTVPEPSALWVTLTAAAAFFARVRKRTVR